MSTQVTHHTAGLRFSTLRPDDADAVVALDRFVFPFDYEGVDISPALAAFEWDRTRGVHVDGAEQLAGQYSVYSQELPVPGGAVPCAGLTWVAVHPQYRRRGILRSMIGDHLAAARERGEPVSALNASEATIYGRFGFGLSSMQLRSTFGRGTALRAVPGADDVRITIEPIDLDRHADVVGDCFEAARRGRPGMVSRNSPAHRRARLDDPIPYRGGGEPLRIMIAEADGDGPARGYVLFRRTGSFSTGGSPDGSVQIREIVARDPAAARALWGRVLDLDLTATVKTDDRPLDDPIFQLLVDRRAAESTPVDGLWVRLVDLPAALQQRRYSTEVDVTFEVTDELLPENAGCWRLSAGPDHATCVRSPEEPAFSIDVRELGSVYLGSTTLDAYASAGLLEVREPETFAATSKAFSWPVQAFCGWRF